MKTNYHTHTPRCMHADGTDELYIQSAINAGFTVLGFADHTPWPYQTDFVSTIRMGMSELSGYAGSLQTLKAAYEKDIQVLIGLECEYFPRYMHWLMETKEALKLDYLLFGAHYLESDEDHPYVGYACVENRVMYQYADMCVAGMSTGVYSYLAHPDLFMRSREKWDEDCQAVSRAICQSALQNRMPLEYNLNAAVLRKGKHSGFPRTEFWECAAQTGNEVILGYDAHQPSLLENAQAELEARALLASLAITPMDFLPC